MNILGLRFIGSHCCPEILLNKTSKALGKIPASLGLPVKVNNNNNNNKKKKELYSEKTLYNMNTLHAG